MNRVLQIAILVLIFPRLSVPQESRVVGDSTDLWDIVIEKLVIKQATFTEAIEQLNKALNGQGSDVKIDVTRFEWRNREEKNESENPELTAIWHDKTVFEIVRHIANAFDCRFKYLDGTLNFYEFASVSHGPIYRFFPYAEDHLGIIKETGDDKTPVDVTDAFKDLEDDLRLSTSNIRNLTYLPKRKLLVLEADFDQGELIKAYFEFVAEKGEAPQ